jgi:heme A synthase
MFVLNCIGYVVLVALLWFAWSRLPAWLRWVDGLLALYVAVVFLGWVDLGGPNPRGLGYLSKGIEILLFATLLVHLWLLSRTNSLPSASRSGDQAVLAR